MMLVPRFVSISAIKFLLASAILTGVIGSSFLLSPQIVDWYRWIRDELVLAFGIGIFLPASIVMASIVLPWKHRGLLQRRFLRTWLASYLMIPLVLGCLAYFPVDLGILAGSSLGGYVGDSIRGGSGVLGVFRLMALGSFLTLAISPSFFRKSATLFSILIKGAILFLFRIVLRGAPRAKNLAVHFIGKIAKSGYISLREFVVARNPASKVNIKIGVAPTPIVPGRTPINKPTTSVSAKTDMIVHSEDLLQDEPLLAKKRDEGKLSEKTNISAKKQQDTSAWSLPAMSLLELPHPDDMLPGIDQTATSKLIETTLSDYGIEVAVSEVKPGPVVTMFGLVPGWIRKSRELKEKNIEGKSIVRRVEDKTRVKVDSIVAREKDLALALAAPSLRIEAPIPGASLVGIEVPNPKPAIVTLRSVMETESFRSSSSKSKLTLGLGMGTGGDVAVADLAKMPHLLIAGSTGSGKSVCINSVIASILMLNSPLETRLLLIDPKRVELTPYNGIPHLIEPVVVDVEVAVKMLKGMIKEMLRRYRVLEEAGVRNIESYNERRSGEDKMPLLVVAVDELADLMMQATNEIERSIIRLAQLGRATGIHLVVATQRPSVDVVTGLIKANFPSRIGFAVASQVDSRTILDSVGAEKLLGRGDMLFQPPDTPKPKRIQGAFISDKEVEMLVRSWQQQSGPTPPAISLEPEESNQAFDIKEGEFGDELLGSAWALAREYNRLSTSLLQRRLRIGYPRAARLMDLLEEEGIVSAGEAGKSREVLAPKVRNSQDLEG